MNSLNLSITHLKSRGSPQNWLRRVPIFRDCNERKYDMRKKKKNQKQGFGSVTRPGVHPVCYYCVLRRLNAEKASGSMRLKSNRERKKKPLSPVRARA